MEGVVVRTAELDDLEGMAAIYNELWCDTLRNRGDVEDADLAARFCVVVQTQSSPIALVAESKGEIVAACMIGRYDNGVPRTNPTWQATYDELFEICTERAKTADEKLEGSLFGDSREKATGLRFAQTGNEYAEGQLNLIIVKPSWQGKGLGRELMAQARAAMRAEGCSKFFLMTDNQSDYEFYDHIGMVRIAEDHSQDTGDGFIVYIYGDTTDH